MPARSAADSLGGRAAARQPVRSSEAPARSVRAPVYVDCTNEGYEDGTPTERVDISQFKFVPRNLSGDGLVYLVTEDGRMHCIKAQ